MKILKRDRRYPDIGDIYHNALFRENNVDGSTKSSIEEESLLYSDPGKIFSDYNTIYEWQSEQLKNKGWVCSWTN